MSSLVTSKKSRVSLITTPIYTTTMMLETKIVGPAAFSQITWTNPLFTRGCCKSVNAFCKLHAAVAPLFITNTRVIQSMYLNYDYNYFSPRLYVHHVRHVVLVRTDCLPVVGKACLSPPIVIKGKYGITIISMDESFMRYLLIRLPPS